MGANSNSRAAVLVVDDEPHTLKALGRILSAYDVTLAADGEEALSAVEQRGTFDAIVCDVMMPGLTGVELFEHLRKYHPALAERLVFVTGGSLGTEIHEYLRAVQNPVLAKPFDVEKLLAAVRRAIEQARRARSA